MLREQAALRPNVRVVEWSERTADDDGELLAGDGLHLTDEGRAELVRMTSRALGRAPAGSEGVCLPTRYTDDSASSPNGTGSGGGSLTGSCDGNPVGTEPPC